MPLFFLIIEVNLYPFFTIISQVGGLQLKAAGALPEDLQAFMDSATEGAVLVSFGSSLRADQMPLEKMQVFLDTFQQLGIRVE